MIKNILLEINKNELMFIYENKDYKIYKINSESNIDIDFIKKCLNDFLKIHNIKNINLYILISLNAFNNIDENNIFFMKTISNKTEIINKTIKTYINNKNKKYIWNKLNQENNEIIINVLDKNIIKNLNKLKTKNIKIKLIQFKYLFFNNLNKSDNFVILESQNEKINVYIYKNNNLVNFKETNNLNLENTLSELEFNENLKIKNIYYLKNNNKESFLNYKELNILNSNLLKDFYLQDFYNLNFIDKNKNHFTKIDKFLILFDIIIFVLINLFLFTTNIKFNININKLNEIKTQQENTIIDINTKNDNMKKTLNNYKDLTKSINILDNITKVSNIIDIIKNIETKNDIKLSEINIKNENEIILKGLCLKYSDISYFYKDLKNQSEFLNINLNTINESNNTKIFEITLNFLKKEDIDE